MPSIKVVISLFALFFFGALAVPTAKPAPKFVLTHSGLVHPGHGGRNHLQRRQEASIPVFGPVTPSKPVNDGSNGTNPPKQPPLPPVQDATPDNLPIGMKAAATRFRAVLSAKLAKGLGRGTNF